MTIATQIVKRDLAKMKPTTLNVFGVDIDDETVAAIFNDLGHINEIYETQAASFYTAYAAFTLDDILTRIEWAHDATNKTRGLEGGTDALLWFAMFRPFENDGQFYWDMKAAHVKSGLMNDIETARRLSLYIYRMPMTEVYTLLLERDQKNGTHDAQEYLDWSVFMALTATSTELATYGTRTFRLDS